MTTGWGISCKIALRWIPLDLANDKSTLVQLMAWCRQATSHSLSQCWPRFMSPHGVTRPLWVKQHCTVWCKTEVGSQNFGYQLWFGSDCCRSVLKGSENFPQILTALVNWVNPAWDIFFSSSTLLYFAILYFTWQILGNALRPCITNAWFGRHVLEHQRYPVHIGQREVAVFLGCFCWSGIHK